VSACTDPAPRQIYVCKQYISTPPSRGLTHNLRPVLNSPERALYCITTASCRRHCPTHLKWQSDDLINTPLGQLRNPCARLGAPRIAATG